MICLVNDFILLLRQPNYVWVGKSFLEVCDLLFEYLVLAWESYILSLQPISFVNDIIHLLILISDLLLKSLLISLLSEPAPNGRLSILQSLSGFFVFDWVFKVRVSTILVNDGILEILLFLVSELLNINRCEVHIILVGVIVDNIHFGREFDSSRNFFRLFNLGIRVYISRSFLIFFYVLFSVSFFIWVT